jgi:uncharacterized protein YciI
VVTIVVTNPDTQTGTFANGYTYNATPIAFVQIAAATPQTASTTVPVTFVSAQAAGDLNIVVVGWNDVTQTVKSVVDSKGNTYSLAVGPTLNTSGGVTQSIYYAKNIAAAAAGSNIVTVTFSAAATYPDVRIVEYSGVNTLDVSAGTTGSSATSSSGAATTTVANELVFGANTVVTLTTAAGSGFTSRLISAPDGDIAEDKIVTAASSNTATATIGSGAWVMQMATFYAGSSGPAPTVTSVSPNNGPAAGGTNVTITGTNFASGATVTFGNTPATNVVVTSSTQITATTPAGTAGSVTVTVTSGGQNGSLAAGFVYVAPPSVTSVSPGNGPTAGGTSITITGTGFASGATVTVGAAAATNVVVVSATQITATTPAGSAGAVTVTVASGGQSGNLGSGFAYVATPTVTGVSPNTGSNAGGTSVTITGTNFLAGAAVTFGGAAATSVVVVNSTQITAKTPAGSTGSAAVTVTVSGQSGSLAGGFTYVVTPTVSSVSPNNGSTAGGTSVTITGTNFVAGATVTFGSAAATNVVVVSSTSITATSPAGSVGAVTVTVSVSGQTGSLASGFTYVATPTVSGVSPNTGSTAGGTAVTITGTNFASGATVTFGSAAATSVVVASSTSITATAPAGAAGAVTVTVTNLGSLSGSLANAFTYVLVPTVSGVSPNDGSTAGGSSVTISGTNFSSGASVSFGGTAATNVVVVSAISITATTPAHAAGAVTVSVTAAGQTGNLASGFTFFAPPTVSSVSPNTGITTGGTSVTIAGTNFASGATVKFGSASATNVAVVSTTSITATTPAGAVGTVTVSVTVNGLTGNLTNGFTYSTFSGPAPTVTSVSPTNGTAAGGTSVTITGANFVSGAAVTFGGTAATAVTVSSGTTITATTPAHTAGVVTIVVTNPDTQTGTFANGYTYNATPIAFVQIAAATPQTASTTVPVTFVSAQAAGDLNIVVVGWNDVTQTVKSVVDSKGNTYSLAVGPTLNTSGGVTQSIYYAKNIAAAAAGSNIVTVTFSAAATYPDVRIVEYSGVNTLDVSAGTTGSSATSSSGAATTTVANELVFGANTVVTLTTAAGSGFTSRLISAPDGDIAEDKIVTAASSNTATATIGSGAWVMQMATFYAGSSGPAPTVTSVSPNNGPAAGGTNVTITGTNFASGATVTFGNTPATNVVVTSSTQITATTPAGTAGSVTVTVTSGGQNGSLAAGFVYVAPPSVTSVSPGNGPTAGGTSITITGTGFASGATVTVGAAAATNVVVVSATQITATTPAGSAGAVTVTVASGGQSGNLGSGFAYVATPTVTGVSPNTGSNAGGTSVTITGTNFLAGAAVTFGGAAATSVVVVNSTQITAKTPAGSTGSAAVTVTVSGQSGSLAGGFTYVVTPTVSSVSPNNGSTAGGTSVTITGTNFVAGATVTFGSAAATNVVVVSSTSITATSPAGSVGAVTVTVSVSGQTGSLASGFTYVATPTVSGVSPNTGSTAGGTAVTITGTNFASGATVTFGSAAATSVVVASSTSITATAPAGAAGAVTVTVTNLGSLSGSLANAFTYVLVPTVSGVSPNDGSTAGGSSVTISGTNFSSGASVSFGGTAATNVVVVSAISITATTPAHAAGAVTVSVTAAGQTGNLASGFTFFAPPTVSSVSPNTGITTGGTSVTIAGTNFASGATVKFGSASATNVAVVSTTSITATTPAGAVGTVTVSVTVNGLTGNLTNGFTYSTLSPAPTVTSVSPNSGPATGATSVTVTGTNFASGAIVTFGGAAATHVVVSSSTTITATTPAHTAGAVAVAVTNTGSQTGTLANGYTYNAVAISFVQVNDTTPQSSTATVAVPYALTQTLGDLNVVIVGWNDTTATVQSVKDSSGNAYALAVGPTSGTALRQSIYYASNIIGGTNTVTVTFSQAATFPDIRILEYKGVNTLDVTAGASGSSATANSGSATTTAANELIVGANMVFTLTTGAGSGFTSRIITPTDGDIAEDEIVSAAGTYSATAPMSSGLWVMQMATFMLASGPPPVDTTPPTAPSNLTGAAPTVQNVQSYINSTALSTHTTAAFDSTGGNLIVVFASSHAGVTMTPSDSFGNTWISAAGPTNTSQGFDLRSQIWYAKNPTVGPGQTFTLNLSAAQSLVISVFVVKGANSTNPIDVISAIGDDAGTGTINVTSPTITTVAANDLLLGFAKSSIAETFTSGTGYTPQPAASSDFLDAENALAIAPGPNNATFVLNLTATWQSAIVAVSPSAASSTETSINLSWTASTDNVGVTAYLVERCTGATCSNFAQVGSSPNTNFTDTGLTKATSYTYRVRATDAAGNLSGYSNSVAISTQP